MKKRLILLLALMCVGFLCGHAMAAPMLSQVLSGSGIDLEGNDYSDTGAEAVTLSDTDGGNDDATVFLLLELAGYANSNIFGIYSYTDNGNGTVSIDQTINIFSGSDDAISSATLQFDVATGDLTFHGTTYSDFGTTFGFYIDVPDNTSNYYSHTSLNTDSSDHAGIYDTSDNDVSDLLGSDVIVAFEDLSGNNSNNDWDYNDMVVGITDVTPVPEPTTVVISSLFLLGAGVFVRRKLHGTV